MKKFTKIFSIVALCAVMVIMSVVPAFAETAYVENHSKVDCANYYIDGTKYMFLIKVPIGTPLDAVSYKYVYSDDMLKLSDIKNIGNDSIIYQYSDSTSDCYMYSYNMGVPGASKPTWYRYGIKLYYDYNGEHYMATNTANGSTTEGPGYILKM